VINTKLHTKYGLLCFVIVLILVAMISGQENKVIDTPHNLSVTGPGDVKAFEEQEVCVFCHLPHNTQINVPLWSHQLPSGPFLVYSSSTLSAASELPGGTSRLCLSCHDGTVAVGDIVGGRIGLMGVDPSGGLPPGAANLFSDLSDDHPISIILNPSATDIVMPADPVHLDGDGKVQCSSCHDPHSNQYGNFLVVDEPQSLCLSCHQKNNWINSTHGQSGISPTGCLACHDEHSANFPERLLHEEDEFLCFNCHQGTMASDIKTIFDSKPYIHPVTLVSGVHDPVEIPFEIRQTPPWLPENSFNAVRHSECTDCHNPHSGSESSPYTGVWGIDFQGNYVNQVSDEFEICFKCHGDSENKPTGAQNLVDIFHVSNPSFHPIEAGGKNADVPSLLYPYDESSIIKCSDCHASSDPGGLKGPHGSDYKYILKKNYTQQNNIVESYFEYELCYECHDRSSILGNGSFSEHYLHIVEEQAPCWTCHSAHGSTSNKHLIDFDSVVVSQSSSGQLEFQDDELGIGHCYLNCHGKDHNPEEYPHDK
jgi:predicted CXXCH cytochrome family protein